MLSEPILRRNYDGSQHAPSPHPKTWFDLAAKPMFKYALRKQLKFTGFQEKASSDEANNAGQRIPRAPEF